MEKKEIEHIYPLTIVEDRYGGCYSKGHYLAFNLEPWEVPEDVNGSDVDCICFWDEDAKEYAIGKGNTAQEAIDDLARKIQPAENVTFRTGTGCTWHSGTDRWRTGACSVLCRSQALHRSAGGKSTSGSRTEAAGGGSGRSGCPAPWKLPSAHALGRQRRCPDLPRF